jgi:transposase
VNEISRIGMDTSKHIFQLHGVNTAEEPVLRKKLRRKEMFAFLEKLTPTVIAIEACGASHHCARLLQSFGHSVKLIAPQLVKPYIKRGKNDAADAEALCEAMSRPTIRFVPVKTAEQQAALMLVGVRDRLIRNRTQLSNAIRGYAGEFGLTAAKGKAHLAPLLQRIHADESLPTLARELFAAQAKEYAQLQTQIDEVDARLMAWHRADECSRRLTRIPGAGGGSYRAESPVVRQSPAPQPRDRASAIPYLQFCKACKYDRSRSQKSARLTASLAALLGAAPITAITGETPKTGGFLTYAIPADAPPSFDAHREATFATVHSTAPFYSVLIRVDPNNPSRGSRTPRRW